MFSYSHSSCGDPFDIYVATHRTKYGTDSTTRRSLSVVCQVFSVYMFFRMPIIYTNDHGGLHDLALHTASFTIHVHMSIHRQAIVYHTLWLHMLAIDERWAICCLWAAAAAAAAGAIEICIATRCEQIRFAHDIPDIAYIYERLYLDSNYRFNIFMSVVELVFVSRYVFIWFGLCFAQYLTQEQNARLFCAEQQRWT